MTSVGFRSDSDGYMPGMYIGIGAIVLILLLVLLFLFLRGRTV
jgi:hypothetical protein